MQTWAFSSSFTLFFSSVSQAFSLKQRKGKVQYYRNITPPFLNFGKNFQRENQNYVRTWHVHRLLSTTVPLKDKRTIKRVDNALGTKSQRIWKKKKRVCELVFFQRICPLLFNFGTFALCYKLVCKLRPQSDCNFSDGKWTSVINWLSINGQLEKKSSGTRKDALV